MTNSNWEPEEISIYVFNEYKEELVNQLKTTNYIFLNKDQYCKLGGVLADFTIKRHRFVDNLMYISNNKRRLFMKMYKNLTNRDKLENDLTVRQKLLSAVQERLRFLEKEIEREEREDSYDDLPPLEPVINISGVFTEDTF